MIHHPTGGEYGDGATDRLRDLTQRQNRQRDSRERPAICRTAWLRAREKKSGTKVRFPLRHHQGFTALAFPIPPGADRFQTPVRPGGENKEERTKCSLRHRRWHPFTDRQRTSASRSGYLWTAIFRRRLRYAHLWWRAASSSSSFHVAPVHKPGKRKLFLRRNSSRPMMLMAAQRNPANSSQDCSVYARFRKISLRDFGGSGRNCPPWRNPHAIQRGSSAVRACGLTRPSCRRFESGPRCQGAYAVPVSHWIFFFIKSALPLSKAEPRQRTGP